jgi:hypothetical protein
MIGRMIQAIPPQIPSGLTGQVPSGAPSQAQQPAIQAGHSQLQSSPNHLMNQNPAPPRSALTSHPLLSTQNSTGVLNNSSFAMVGAKPAANAQPQVMPVIPPLHKERFESGFANWCNSRGISFDLRAITVDGRPVDLHELHCYVMRAGGISTVCFSYCHHLSRLNVT